MKMLYTIGCGSVAHCADTIPVSTLWTTEHSTTFLLALVLKLFVRVFWALRRDLPPAGFITTVLTVGVAAAAAAALLAFSLLMDFSSSSSRFNLERHGVYTTKVVLKTLMLKFMNSKTKRTK